MIGNDSHDVIFVEQTVHGYRRGHELLAQSVRLPPEDLDELRRLSDLSGIVAGEPIPTHLTTYPLPSGDFQAVAKTWLDVSAERAGCVVTQTLLVPAPSWRAGIDVHALMRLFAKPRKDSSPLPSLSVDGRVPFSSSADWPKEFGAGVGDFSLRLVQGIEPIIWPIQSNDLGMAEDFLSRLLIWLWPSKRATFSATTYALQPRKAADKIFDLMFVPRQAVGRFSTLADSHIVGRPYSAVRIDKSTYAAANVVAASLSGFDSNSSHLLAQLKDELPPAPSVIRKVFTLAELEKLSHEDPMSLAAALDVWGSLAPMPTQAVEQKLDAVSKAIARARELPPSTALSLLVAISQRLRRPPFRLARPLSANLRGAMQDVIARVGPSVALECIEQQRKAPKELLMALSVELSKASAQTVFSVLDRMGTSSPDSALRLLAFAPRLSVPYLEVEAIDKSAQLAGSSRLNTWLSDLTPSIRRAIFSELLTTPTILSRPDLLAEALEVSEPDDAIRTLMLPRYFQAPLDDRVIPMLLRVALKDPERAAFLYRKERVVCDADVEVFCASLSASPNSLRILAEPHIFDGNKRRLRALSKFGALNMEKLGRESTSQLVTSILRAYEPEPLTDRNLRPLLQNSSSVFVAREINESELTRIANTEIGGFVLAWLFEGAVANSLSAGESIHPYLRFNLIRQRLVGCSRHELSSLLLKREWRQRDAMQAAMLLDAVAPVLVGRQDSALAEFVDDALHLFSPSHADQCVSWCHRILGHVKQSPALAPTAHAFLTFALDHPRWDVGPVAVASFPSAYNSLPKNRNPDALEWVLFSFVSDRRKDLRRRLVSAYVSSNWAPGGLAISAAAVNELERFIPEILAQGGPKYLKRMQTDLERWGDAGLRIAKEMSKKAASSFRLD